MFTLMDGYMTLLLCCVLCSITMVMFRIYVHVDMVIERAWVGKLVDQDNDTINTITHKEEAMSIKTVADPERMDKRALRWYMHDYAMVRASRSPIVHTPTESTPTIGYWYTKEDMCSEPIAMADDYVIDYGFVVRAAKEHCDALAEVVCRHAQYVSMQDIEHITYEVPTFIRREMEQQVEMPLPMFSPMYSKHITRTVVNHNINTMAKVA